jgi:hypothetical protein
MKDFNDLRPEASNETGLGLNLEKSFVDCWDLTLLMLSAIC